MFKKSNYSVCRTASVKNWQWLLESLIPIWNSITIQWSWDIINVILSSLHLECITLSMISSLCEWTNCCMSVSHISETYVSFNNFSCFFIFGDSLCFHYVTEFSNSPSWLGLCLKYSLHWSAFPNLMSPLKGTFLGLIFNPCA